MNLLSYFYVLISLVVLDSIWLLGVAKSFYTKRLDFLFKEKADMLPIVIFYIIYAFGVSLLVVNSNIENLNITKIFLLGFVFGVCAYSAYDLTNHATIANWPISVTILDILWGGFVTALSSSFAFWLIK